MIFLFGVILLFLSYFLYRLVRDRGLFFMILGICVTLMGFYSFLGGVILDRVIRNRVLNINVSVITGYVLDKFLVYTIWLGIMGMVIFGMGLIIRFIYEKR